MRQLTEEEIESCKTAPQFSAVRAIDVFGSQASYGLAARIAKANICRYRELREEWEYESGLRPRDDAFYDKPASPGVTE